MTMRRPDSKRPPAGPSADFLGGLLANSRPLAPKDIASEQLADELRTAESNLANPRWDANASPEQLTAERLKRMSVRDELNGRTLQPDGAGHKVDREAFRIAVASDGSARIEDKRNLRFRGLGGTFDVTDAGRRDKGIDPYASYKLKLLDETRDERVAIGKRYRKQELARSPQHMANNLARLWATTADASARKQGLFELWDDCAETGSDDLVAGGRAARDYVVGFIRTKLPAGTAAAFTADELAQLDRRRKSRTTFTPYE